MSVTHGRAVTVRWWLHPRVWALAAAIATSLLGLSGISAQHLFHQPSTLKVVLTIALPVVAGLLCGMLRSHLILGILVVVVAPFAFVATIAGLSVSPLTLVLGVAVVTTRWREPVYGRQPRSALTRASLIFILCMAVPLIEGSSRVNYVQLLLTGLLTAYVISQIAQDPDCRKVLVLAFVASAGIQAALATWEFATGHRLNLYGASNGGSFGTDYFFNFDNKSRSAAGLPDPIALGNVLALACPLTLCAGFMVRNWFSRLAVCGIGVLLVIGLVSTLSRLSWVGAAVGTLVAVVLLPGRQRLAAAAGLAVTFAVALSLAIGIGGAALIDRFNSILNPTSSQVVTAQGDITRLELQHVALSVARAHPLTGVGLGNLPPYLIAQVPGASKASHAHNTYYNLLAEGGLLAGTGLAVFFWAAFIDGRRGFRRDRTAVSGAAGAIVALLLVWTTDYTIRNASVFSMVAIVFAIIAACSRGEPTDAAAVTNPENTGRHAVGSSR